VAFARRAGDDYWVRIPRVASFRFSPSADRVEVVAGRDADAALIQDQYYRSILPLALQVRGHEVLHASAVRAAAGVLALAAPRESGKSTLAFALSQRGYPLWADDSLVFEVDGERVRTLALPFDLRLRAAPAKLFGRDRIVQVSRAGRSGAVPVELAGERLAGVVLLAKLPSDALAGRVELERVTGGEAVAAILEHAFCFSLEDAARKQRMMRQYLGLAARVPVWRLRYPAGLERLPQVLARLEEAAGPPPAAG
jgi:hypothetical protein